MRMRSLLLVLSTALLVSFAGAGSYCIRPDYICKGHDIISKPKLTFDDCKALCEATDGCLSIAYHTDGLPSRDNCYVKSYACADDELTAHTDNGGDDYVRIPDGEDCFFETCIRPGKGCQGHDIDEGNYEFEECRDRCFDNQNCYSFSHHQADLACWIKNYVCKDSELRDITGTGGSDYVVIPRGHDCDTLMAPYTGV